MNESNAAFTLIEALIVVIVLGIIAMIIIPQFGTAADEARQATLLGDLRTIREQVELYRAEHGGSSPVALGTGPNQLTARTSEDGALNPQGRYGPYLQAFPANPFNRKTTVEVEDGTAGLGDGSHGWHLDTSTGLFTADTCGHGHL